MQKKVSVLGHFGEGKNLLNGQTIKTRIITEELQKQLGYNEVLKFDSHGGWKKLLKAPFQVFSALKNSENILVFPAHNGLRVYAPLLFFQRYLFKNRKLHYVVIGGWLPQFLSKRKQLSKVLKNFDFIYVETKTMKKALEEQGFSNIYVLPNCKNLAILSDTELVYPDNSPYKLCTFSRVMKEKGIEEAVNAVITVNKELGYKAFTLDIYGQVDAEQTEWFDNLQQKFPDYINYCGEVAFENSVEVLKHYYALLFPTYYEGEGFAGTLIDAFSAGVPVIASDWKYNIELVNENTGYVFSTGNQREFVEILKAIIDTDMINNKRHLCLKEAEKYRVEKVVEQLIQRLGEI